MTRYRLETPVAGVTTDIGPAHFHLGVAEVDDTVPGIGGVLAYCRHNGYAVVDLDEQAAAERADDVPDDDNDPKTPPPGNASAAVWRDHLLAVGVAEDQVRDLNRDQLRELAATLGKEGQTA